MNEITGGMKATICLHLSLPLLGTWLSLNMVQRLAFLKVSGSYIGHTVSFCLFSNLVPLSPVV